MGDLSFRLQLDDCIKWIHQNQYKRVVIELKQDDMKYAAIISDHLTKKLKELALIDKSDCAEVYITRSNSCSVDLIVTQHITNVDAIIHLGQVCLTKSQLKNQDSESPVYFAFSRISNDNLVKNVGQMINEKVSSLRQKESETQICIFYDTCLIDLAISLTNRLKQNGFDKFCDVAKLNRMHRNWHTSDNHHDYFKHPENEEEFHTFGQFLTKRSIKEYNYGIYLGDKLSIASCLSFPGTLFRIQFNEQQDIEELNTTKLLYKRVALVDQIKDLEELKIGVILTNPLPDVPTIMERLHSYAKQRRHTLYFITMIQTIDECKIGNFDLCDAFVIINSCTCSTILESLFFNRPIISELEFKLACGFEVEYGKVLWPGTSTHLTEDDMLNRRKVSDVSLALIHTRNELLERCSQARANKWSGLDYNKAAGDNEVDEETLDVEDGLHGIASSYANEPPIEKNEK